MTQDVIIGIDAGTSVIKALAFDLDGAQLAMTTLPNTYASLGDGGVEQDMARTWSDTARVLRRLGDQIDDLAGRCAAIAVTGQGPASSTVTLRRSSSSACRATSAARSGSNSTEIVSPRSPIRSAI